MKGLVFFGIAKDLIRIRLAEAEEYQRARNNYMVFTNQEPAANLNTRQLEIANKIIEYCITVQGLNVEESINIANEHIEDEDFLFDWSTIQHYMMLHLINFKKPGGVR